MQVRTLLFSNLIIAILVLDVLSYKSDRVDGFLQMRSNLQLARISETTVISASKLEILDIHLISFHVILPVRVVAVTIIHCQLPVWSELLKLKCERLLQMILSLRSQS